MKRIVLSLLLLLSSVSIYAQEMPSVAGVTFGMGRRACKAILDKKFSSSGSSLSAKDELNYYDIKLGGEHFTYCTFYFQEKGSETFLCRAVFVKAFPIDEEINAERMQNRLLSLYKEKYPLVDELVNDDGFTVYGLGKKPKSKEPLITINIRKGTNNGGKKKIVTYVQYSVDDFVDPTNDI